MNYNWHYAHFVALCDEYTYRYGNCYFCDNYGWVAMGKYEGMN